MHRWGIVTLMAAGAQRYVGRGYRDDAPAHHVRETNFPRSLFISDDDRVVGTWIMGNDYRVKSTYHGGYPAGYLKRVKSLFPDKKHVLHLFSGKVDLVTFPGDTVDLNPSLSPTYVDDAQTLTRVPLEHYDLALADPPYSVEGATTIRRQWLSGTSSCGRSSAYPKGRMSFGSIKCCRCIARTCSHLRRRSACRKAPITVSG